MRRALYGVALILLLAVSPCFQVAGVYAATTTTTATRTFSHALGPLTITASGVANMTCALSSRPAAGPTAGGPYCGGGVSPHAKLFDITVRAIANTTDPNAACGASYCIGCGTHKTD